MAGGSFIGPMRGQGNDTVFNDENVVDEKIVKLQDEVDALQDEVDTLGSADPRTNGGRLAVTPAYMNTTGASALQLNSSGKKALFGWTQEVAYSLETASVHFAAATSFLRAGGGVYLADENGEPTGDSLADIFDAENTFTFPETYPGWARIALATSLQLYPNKRYVVVVEGGDEGTDFSLSYNRQDTGQYSGLVPGCWSKQKGENLDVSVSMANAGAVGVNTSYRTLINAGMAPGNHIQVAFTAGTADLTINNASIMRDAGGVSGVGVGDIVPLLFSGQASVVIPGGTTLLCDETAFVVDPLYRTLICIDAASGSGMADNSVALPAKISGGFPCDYPTTNTLTPSGVGWSASTRFISGFYITDPMWVDLKKDAQPALLNIVLCSTANHVPQLVYGWDGRHGNKVALYNTDTSTWELKTIANAGYFIDVSSETEDVALNVFAQWVVTDFILSLDINLGRTFQDGIEIVGGGDGDRFLGIIAPINRISTYQAPIRCETANFLWNAENQTEQVMCRQPYVAFTQATPSAFGWVKFQENDDYRIKLLVGNQTITTTVLVPGVAAAVNYFGVAVDVIKPVLRAPIIVKINSTNNDTTLPIEATIRVSEGLHSIWPILAQNETNGHGNIEYAGSYPYWYQYSPCDIASMNGGIVGAGLLVVYMG